MDRAREDLLAGAALAADQQRRLGRRNLPQHRTQRAHRIASPRLAEQVVERLRVRDGAPEFLDPDVQAAVVRGARDGETERVLCW